MASAAERAVEVVDDVLMRYDDLFDSIPADVVEALMADPDLLVDLAIEAGGLEQADGAWLTAARCNHDAREWCDEYGPALAADAEAAEGTASTRTIAVDLAGPA